MVTPRNLDPKFKDVKPEDMPNDVEETEQEQESTPDDRSMTVHHEYYMDGSVRKVRTHGPMPSEDWPAYEKKHGL